MINKNFSPLFILLLIVAVSCAPVTEPPAPSTATQPPTSEPTLAEPTPTATLEPVHLTIASYPYITEAPYFLAEANGYFAEQALEVEFVRFQASSEVIPALAAGDLDVTTVFPGAAFFNAIARGAAIRVVSGKGYLDPQGCAYTGFMARTELLNSGRLNDPANWQGLKVATEKGAMAEFGLEKLLTQNGLSLDDIELVDLPAANRLDGLANAAIDIAGAGEPWLTRIRNAGAGEVWVSFNQLLPDTSWGLVAYGPNLLEKRPDIGRRFMIAFLKGLIAYNEGKTDNNVAVLAARTQLDPAEVAAMCWNTMQPDGSINAQSLLDYQQWAVSRGYLTEIVPTENFWDPQFVEYANANLP